VNREAPAIYRNSSAGGNLERSAKQRAQYGTEHFRYISNYRMHLDVRAFSQHKDNRTGRITQQCESEDNYEPAVLCPEAATVLFEF